jgi:hypothetical protein
MCAVLIESAAVFALCTAIQVLIWRIRRPERYHQWLPALVAIFLVAGPSAAWWLVARGLVAGSRSFGPLAEWVAVLLLHGSASAVYIIGYTLVSAFSPSIEILKLLERTSGGLTRADIQLPFLDSALGGNRVVTLVADGMVRADGDRVRLGPRGQTLASLVLFYRHAIGLPDRAGG